MSSLRFEVSPVSGKRYRAFWRTRDGQEKHTDFGSATSSVFNDYVCEAYGVCNPNAEPDHGNPDKQKNWWARHSAIMVDTPYGVVSAVDRPLSPAWFSSRYLWS